MRALLLVSFLLPTIALAQPDSRPPVLGRWDLTVRGKSGTYPSWLELSHSGFRTVVGRFVGQVGSARPIQSVEVSGGGNTFRFAIPPQWQRENADLRLEGSLEGEKLQGTIVNPDGSTDTFTGVRAPTLERARRPAWGASRALFDGKSLAGWHVEGGKNSWSAKPGGILANAGGGNIVTDRKFEDFRLHLEVRFPKGGNSGVYLRGRHEVQVEDTPASQYPLPDGIGGVYGFLYPNENASSGPGVWNTFDITLVGRRVTVVLNGKTVICDQIIPGPTGGALDANEGEPGPILLQGDHTAVEYRNVRIAVPK